MSAILTRLYRYVGPAAIAEEARAAPSGAPVRSLEELRGALTSIAGSTRETVTCTFIVDRTGVLRLADRSSEHVACADGGPVMAAGEITVTADGAVHDVSNQSTGFCPEVGCWPALARTLRAAGLDDPGDWTASFEFRRCPGCAARTLVKERIFECAECGDDLPEVWNFDPTVCRRAVVRLGDVEWVVDAIEAPAVSNEDRVSVTLDAGDLILGLADGASGMTGGREAAELVVDEARTLATEGVVALLGKLDRQLAETTGGETTAVMVRLTPDGTVEGASVGDSEVWVAGGDDWSELTGDQSRKPLLGSGCAVPTPFGHAPVQCVLLCSDGVSKYVRWNELLALLEGNGADLPWRVVDAARLPSGELQDDFSLLYVRRAPR